jgi:hypothetical protein
MPSSPSRPSQVSGPSREEVDDRKMAAPLLRALESSLAHDNDGWVMSGTIDAELRASDAEWANQVNKLYLYARVASLSLSSTFHKSAQANHIVRLPTDDIYSDDRVRGCDCTAG